jgi:phosphate/sulfate permease
MLYFQIILGILVLLAITDLIVGVSNDAVNFLNSAIGAKAASFRTILVIASAGVLLGTLFSSGMMQIARNGIFQPEFFTFDKVMLIFLAVMITDVILLDIYNSLGLPTSTTVSLIFELLGASFVIGLLILFDQQRPLSEIESILNYKNALFIIGGIFFSVIVAFGMGSCIHFFTRLLFTFKLKKSLTLFGPVFTGISTSALMYFLLIKGLEGSSFASSSMLEWIQHNTFLLLSACFVLVTLFTSIAMRLWKFDPLRIIVLIGTFSLAMAFAGNDLVNFIGIFVAAFSSYEAWVVSDVAADAFGMGVLNQPVITPSALLLFSGVIMVLTLWISAKSKKVTETEVSLSRQDAGEEKFASSTWSRGLVSSGIYAGSVIKILMPEKWTSTIEKRFRKPKAKKKNGEEPSFDMLRASVNLVVSSTLIAFGTAQHLPLSTTFVTFMVAMGTTFADQAWGRESAVYRVSGVLQVLKGWVLTALVAFGGSALVALFLYFTGSIGALSLTLFTFGLLVYSHMLFKQKQQVEKEGDEFIIKESIASNELIDQSKLKAALTIERVNR